MLGHPLGNPATLERSGTVNAQLVGVPPKYSLDALITMLVVLVDGCGAPTTSSICDPYSGCAGISARHS
jgi:hypothetical protein